MSVKLNQLIERGGVLRHHTKAIHTIKQQTVAEHSWGLAMLFYKLFPELVTKEILMFCLYHDLGEYDYGDIPFNSKFSPEEIQENMYLTELFKDIDFFLNKKVRLAFKFCDIMEYYFFCKREIALGSKFYEDKIFKVRIVLAKKIEEIKENFNEQKVQFINEIIGEDFQQ